MNISKFVSDIKNKIKKNSFFIIIILIIVKILLIYYFFSNKINKYIYNTANFEDTEKPSENTPETTISPALIQEQTFGKNGAPEMGPPKTCKFITDVVGVCVDYETCCSIPSENNKCACEHPFTKSCKTNYDSCIKDANGDKNMIENCKSTNSGCCKEYNNIKINSSNFTGPKHITQTDSKICRIASGQNIESKCLELCQTNSECASYSTTDYSCDLFNKVTQKEKVDSKGNSIGNTSINYYTKNV